MQTGCVSTRFGWVAFAASPKGVIKVTLPARSERAALRNLHLASSDNSPPNPLPCLKSVRKMLSAYFEGEPVDFHAIPLDRSKASRFQLIVWKITARIPYGKTISYAELARRAGSPSAARAVGQCMARNPFPILIPCHRVIGSSGSLRGFGGGLRMKRALLKMEGAL